MSHPLPVEPTSELTDATTWSADDSGSHAVDRELERELVRAALFDGGAVPRIGRFAVGERLGAGASSVVYAAWDDLLARRVAVKILVADSSATRHQVEREAHALGQLSHRNIVAVYDVGEWRGHAFIAMELVVGATLACWQAARTRSTAELIDAYLQAGRGLAAAHEAGFVHRDFKPANVMVAGDGRVVVTDFGLAGGVTPDAQTTVRRSSAGDSARTTRPAIGTPAYVAPEQRRGATAHPSADIYSFAVALCEALIGWHPMRGDEARWKRALARRVPRRIYEAICTGLARQPSARGDTMGPLLAALAPPLGRRWRGVAIAIAGLAVGAAAIGFLARGGRAAMPEPAPRAVFVAPSLGALVQRIDALLAAPPRAGDPAAAAALRAVLLSPLPTELPCSWPAPLVAFAFTEGHALGLDEQGRVHACALDSGTIVPEGDGAVRVLPTGGRATDRAGQITAIMERGELRIVDGAGSLLSRHPVSGPNVHPPLDVSRDGSRVLVASQRGSLVWWQGSTGQWREEPLYFKDPTVSHVRLNPSGSRALMTSSLGSLEVRHLGGGTAQWLTSDSIIDATFLDDDTVIGSDADHRLWRWDLASQRAGVVAVHPGAVWSTASNAEIVASGAEGGTLTVVDRRTGAQRHEIRLASDIYSLLLDGDRLIAAGNDGLRMWDWRSGALLSLADGQGHGIWDVEAGTAADGTRVYLAGALRHAAIFAWDTRAQMPVYATSLAQGRISDVAVSADGRTAAAVDLQGELLVIDVAARRVVSTIAAHAGGPAYRVAFDLDTATIVTVGQDGYLRTWAPPETAPHRSVLISHSAVYGLDVRGGRAVTAGDDGGVALVDLASGQIVRRYRGHHGAARTVQFRADGAWFVTGGNDFRACLWRIDEEDCHTWLDGHDDSVLGATFADDGAIFTTSRDGTVRSWWPTYDQPVEVLLAELARHGARR